MSKLSFRARALDATKPLPIYNAVDLPDLSEYSTINRTVPQMPTGMEKEEETVSCLAPKRPPFLMPPFLKWRTKNFNFFWCFLSSIVTFFGSSAVKSYICRTFKDR